MPNEKETVYPNSVSMVSMTLLSVFILMIYSISGPLLQNHAIEIINDKTITIASGIVCMALHSWKSQMHSREDTIQLNSDIVMSFLLPAFMFSIGYNVRREFLFKYFKYILVYGLCGTLLTFLIISQFLSFAQSFSLINVELTRDDIICFASALNSVDFFNTNQMIEKYSQFETKKAFAITLGECLMNNSLNLALLHIFTIEERKSVIWDVHNEYVVLFIRLISFLMFSIVVGVTIGCLSAFFFKQLESFKLNKVQQIILLLLFGLFSYSAGSLLNVSPIISLLTCAFCMSHYTFFNLSFQAREESSLISKTIAHFAEGVIYTFIGLTFLQNAFDSFSLSFTLLGLVSIVLSRFITALLLTKGFNMKLSRRQFCIITFTNVNRGIMSICITSSIASSNKQIFLSSMMAIILITNALTCVMLRRVVDEEVDPTFMQLRQLIVSFSNSNSYLNPKVSSQFNETFIKDWIKVFWREFDNKYIKKVLVNNWPEVRDEYAELVREIHSAFTSNSKERSNSSVIAEETEKLDGTDNNSYLKKSIVSFHSNTKLRESVRDLDDC